MNFAFCECFIKTGFFLACFFLYMRVPISKYIFQVMEGLAILPISRSCRIHRMGFGVGLLEAFHQHPT